MPISLSSVRKVIFVATTLVSLVVLAMSAHLTSVTTKYAFYFTFAAVGIGASILTCISLPTLLFFNRMVIVELSWSLFLGTIWIATAGDAAAANATSYLGNCGTYKGLALTACYEIQIVEAFSFFNWILVLSYTIALLTFGIHVAGQGRRAWTVGVKDITWNANNSIVQQSLLGYPAQPPSQSSMFSQPRSQGYTAGYSQQYSPPATQPYQGQGYSENNYHQQYTPPPPQGQGYSAGYQQQYNPPPPPPPQGEGYSSNYQQHPPPPGSPPSNEGHSGYHQQYPPSPNPLPPLPPQQHPGPSGFRQPSPPFHPSSGQSQPGGYAPHYPQGQAPSGQGYPGGFPPPPQAQQY